MVSRKATPASCKVAGKRVLRNGHRPRHVPNLSVVVEGKVKACDRLVDFVPGQYRGEGLIRNGFALGIWMFMLIVFSVLGARCTLLLWGLLKQLAAMIYLMVKRLGRTTVH